MTRRGVLAAVSALSEGAEPLLLVVEDAERLDGDERELLLALLRSLPSRGNLGLLVSSRQLLAGDGVQGLECGPLPDGHTCVQSAGLAQYTNGAWKLLQDFKAPES